MNVKLRYREGSTLITAILILLLIIAIGIGITFSLNSRTRVIRFSSQGVTAQYVAESGMELALATLTQSRFDRDTFADTSSKLSSLPLDVPFQHDGEVQDVNVIEGSARFQANIVEDQQVAVDLVTSDQQLSEPLSKIALQWEPTDGFERVEVSWSGLDGNLVPTDRTFLTTSDASGVEIALGVDPNVGTRVQIKVLGSSVNNLVLVPLNDVGNPVKIEPSFQIEVTGKYGESEWTKRMVAPWRTPSTPLLQYVLFSDDPLQKPVL